MTTVKMPLHAVLNVKATADSTLQDIKFKIDDWQDTYDERDTNEPEYDSQIDRWQDALDRLEEKIDDATELADDYEEWVDNLGLDTIITTTSYIDIEIDKDGLFDIIERLKNFNQEYRGLSKIIKEIEKITKAIKTYEVRQ